MQDLLTLGRKSEIQFALGQRSFDEWDAYVETWRKSGGQELLDEAAEAARRPVGVIMVDPVPADWIWSDRRPTPRPH